MKPLNTVCHVEIIRHFIKIGTSDCYCGDKKALLDVRATRSGSIHQLVFSLPLSREDNNTEIRGASCPGGG